MQTSTSIPAQRHQLIQEYLLTHTGISIKEAASLCNVSEATARRDLDDLAAEGILDRTHGGAVIHKGTALEEYQGKKMSVMVDEKKRIAKAAMQFIKDEDSIFLDSGTTCLFLGYELQPFQRLTVITNNLSVASSVLLDTTSTMIVTGGVRRDGYDVLIGDITEKLIREFNVDITFVGADAVSVENGVYNSCCLEVGVKKSIITSGKKKILLADHSKFEKTSLIKICDIESFDVVITDDKIEENIRKILEKKAINLLIV